LRPVGQIERDQRLLRRAVETADEPVHILGPDAVIVLQPPFHEDRGGGAELRRTDPLALEISTRPATSASPPIIPRRYARCVATSIHMALTVLRDS